MTNRLVNIEVRTPSWAGKTIPTALNPPATPHTFVIEDVLHLIGILTIPGSASGNSLSEYWAWLRYFNAISSKNMLYLKNDYKEIDSHQKTILSDDFGMGFPIHYLQGILGYNKLCDGVYFLKHFAPLVGANYIGKIAKNGARKTPDFICWSSSLQKYHTIECKGTQSGLSALDAQIEAGKTQVKNISFPAGSAGETIVAGLLIGCEWKDHEPLLRIEDPSGDPILSVKESQLDVANDTILRGFTSKLLSASGFAYTSSVVMHPDGESRMLSLMGMPSVAVDRQKRFADANASAAKVEMGSRAQRTFGANGKKFAGREAIIDLPREVFLDGKRYRSAIVRHGMNVDFVKDMRPDKMQSESILDFIPGLGSKESMNINFDNGVSEITVGDSFYSSLELEQ